MVDLLSSPRDRGFRCSVLVKLNENRAPNSIIAADEKTSDAFDAIRWEFVPRKLSGHGLAERKAKRLDDGIVNCGPYLTDLLIGASGIHPIGKKYDE